MKRMEFTESQDRLIVALPLGDAFPAGLAHQLAGVAGGLKVRPSHLMRSGPEPIKYRQPASDSTAIRFTTTRRPRTHTARSRTEQIAS